MNVENNDTSKETVEIEDAEVLSFDEADDLLAALDADDPETDSEGEEGEETADEEILADDDEEGDEPVLEADDEDTADGEDDQSESARFVGMDGKVRLEDGTITTVDELRKSALRQADYTRKTQEVASERKAVEERTQRVAQLEGEIGQQREFLMNVLQQVLPHEPDVALSSEDPFGYMQQKAAYDSVMTQLNGLQQQHAQATEKQQQEAYQAAMQTQERERSLLIEAVPELQDTEKFGQFVNEAVKYGAEYGLTQDEVMGTSDHRAWLVMQDAIKYRKLQSQRTAARKKGEGKPPVQRGGTRKKPATQKNQAYAKGKQRLRSTGDANTAEALLSQWD